MWKDPIKSVTEKNHIFQIDTALSWVTEAKILFKKTSQTEILNPKFMPSFSLGGFCATLR